MVDNDTYLYMCKNKSTIKIQNRVTKVLCNSRQ